MYQTLRKKLHTFLNTISFCFSLSWRTSKTYTCLRLLCNLSAPFISVILSILGKQTVDLLTGDLSVSDPKNTLILLLLALLLVNAIRSFSQKAQQYVQSMHGELISNELALKMMERAGQADLEYFDNPDYYDKLTACMRDAPVISHLIWNVLAVLSSLVSFILSFSILCRANALYGICMLCAAIPSSIAALRYTKLIYHLSLEQINGERQKGYLQNLAVDRRFAQDLRIFNAAKSLRER